MGKFKCEKHNKYIFACELCPIDEVRKCTYRKCWMVEIRRRGAYDKMGDFLRIFKKTIEPLSYSLAFDNGVIPDIDLKLMPKKSWHLTRRLWSLPEYIGHRVHNGYLVKEKKHWWWRVLKPFFKGLKGRNNALCEYILRGYEKDCQKKYKHFKIGVWAGRNKKLQKECYELDGYKGYLKK